MFQFLAITQAGCRRSFPRHLLHRITTLAISAIVVLVAQVIYAQPVNADQASRPNIVLIMADDLGYGDLSSYGGWIKTPHLDRLAATGLKFSDFHSSGNVCSPTRAGLMTGRYQQRAGIPGVVFADEKKDVHFHGLQTSETTFAELLKEAGYRTAIFGKWHLGYFPKYNPIHHGFGEFKGYVSGNVDFFSHIDQSGTYDWWHQDKTVKEEGYVTHLITKHAVRFIEENKNRPFCLYLPHEAPHYPYQGPNDKADRSVNGKFNNNGSRRDIKRAYREMVTELDKGVDQVIAALRKNNLDKNTMVLFFSDNGANKNGSNGKLRGAKGSNWEGGHRVPCIANWPETIKPGVTDQLAISLDVFPTVLAAAGVQFPESLALDGVNLMPLLRKGHRIGSRKLVWNGRAMRDGTWKLIVNGKGAQGVGLYDLSEDISEKKNLAQMHPDRVAAMQKHLADWQADMNATMTKQPGRPTTTSGKAVEPACGPLKQ